MDGSELVESEALPPTMSKYDGSTQPNMKLVRAGAPVLTMLQAIDDDDDDEMSTAGSNRHKSDDICVASFPPSMYTWSCS